MTASTATAAITPTLDTGDRQALASMRMLRVLLLLCILVPVLLFAGFAAHRWSQVHQEAEVRLDRALRIANEHALKLLDTNETLLRHLSDLAAAAPVTHRQLQALANGKPQLRALWVIDREGRTIASSRFETPPPELQFAGRESFRWHRENPLNGNVFFSEVVNATPGERAFDMSRVVLDERGEFAGMVAVSVAPEYFVKFHGDLSANEPGLAITTFRQDGLVYSRWPRLTSAPARMSNTSPVLSRVLRGEQSGTIRGISSLDRRDRVILFQRVGGFPVFLGTGLELAAIRAAWLSEVGLIGAFAAVPVLGLLIAAIAAMKRSRQALEAARRLQQEAEARRHVEEALRQSQKMEAMGRLTGGVAHDFNNALMVISANLHMLKLTQPQVEGRQTEAIARAISSATNLTRQLLAFSRRQALMPQVVLLQDRLPQMKDLLGPVLGSQVPLAVEVEPSLPPIEVDVAELELALINLAVNAKDAMPSGGSFSVRARLVEGPHPLTGAAVCIEAEDTGAGIPPDVLARVFEPFFTTKPVGAGTGLGLSQVYGLCERSGGTARVASTVGQGTTVTMYFPPAPAGAEHETDVPDAIPSQLGLRVLLVEDNADVAAAIRPVLEMLDCEIAHFAAAQPAVEWLRQHAGDVDLVLTDVVMPGEMDGLGFAQHVRDTYPALGLVVMTGYAQHLEEITRQGFAVLAKPWNAAHLSRVLRAGVRGRAQNFTPPAAAQA